MHGIIEARVNGIWGRVCLHDFDDSDASVACRHFGFDGGVAYLHIMKNDRPVLVRDVRCNGNKLFFSLCRERRPTARTAVSGSVRPKSDSAQSMTAQPLYIPIHTCRITAVIQSKNYIRLFNHTSVNSFGRSITQCFIYIWHLPVSKSIFICLHCPVQCLILLVTLSVVYTGRSKCIWCVGAA